MDCKQDYQRDHTPNCLDRCHHVEFLSGLIVFVVAWYRFVRSLIHDSKFPFLARCSSTVESQWKTSLAVGAEQLGGDLDTTRVSPRHQAKGTSPKCIWPDLCRRCRSVASTARAAYYGRLGIVNLTQFRQKKHTRQVALCNARNSTPAQRKSARSEAESAFMDSCQSMKRAPTRYQLPKLMTDEVWFRDADTARGRLWDLLHTARTIETLYGLQRSCAKIRQSTNSNRACYTAC